MSSSPNPSAPLPATKEVKGKKIFLTLTLSTVGLAGVLLAFFLLFGDDEGRGATTALVILLADVYLIAGFFAKQGAVKVTSWLLTLYMFLAFMVLAWFPNASDVTVRQDTMYINNCLADNPYSCAPGYVSLDELLRGLSLGAWVLASFGVIAALLTLTWSRIQNARWVRKAYYGTLAMFGLAGILYAIYFVVELFTSGYDSLIDTATAALVLAGTGLAIVVTFALVNNPKKTGKLEASLTETESVEGASAGRFVVDFRSPEAREAFYEFMREYEYNKASSFSVQPAEAEAGADEQKFEA